MIDIGDLDFDLIPTKRIDQFSPKEIAQQLSLIELEMLNSISNLECLNKSWSKKNGKATNIKNMIALTNGLGDWISDWILGESNQKKRVNILKKVILIAEECLQLQNYDTLMAIVSSLNSASVHRLRKTFDELPKGIKAKLDVLISLMSNADNFGQYRQKLQSTDRPAIPFLGIYLTDLTFIADGNKDFVYKNNIKLINFKKCEMTAQVIDQIAQFQNAVYPFKTNKELETLIFLTFQKTHESEDQRYKNSLMLEQRE